MNLNLIWWRRWRPHVASTPSTWPSESPRVRSTQVYDDVETEVDEVFYVDLLSLECTTNDEIEETQLIDLKSEDNRTAEVTIIDDDEPGVIAYDLGVPRCCGAFTPSMRLVAIARCRGWLLFRV